MPDSSRIDDLRRRVQKDPASIAFAQLAEECRRAGECEEAVSVARSGLATHPGYLSARVTLGRALIEINQLDEAEVELRLVLKSAPENLAAIRGLAEIEHRRGHLTEALAHYRSALTLARNDPDLEQTVADLARQVEPPLPKPGAGGLSLEHLTQELSRHVPPPKPIAAPPKPAPAATPPSHDEPVPLVSPSLEAPVAPVASVPVTASPDPADPPDPDRTRALQTIDALEGWLTAIDAARADRRA